MAKDDQEEALEKILSGTLARVIEFNKFAEAKNGILATFSSGWVLALVGMLVSGKDTPKPFLAAAYLALPVFAISALLCIYSLLPKTKLPSFTRLQSTEHEPNLLYYGDIAALGLDDLKRLVLQHYMPAVGSSVTNRYISDLCIQIGVVSRIAIRKFDLFSTSLYFSVGALLMVFVALFINSAIAVNAMF